jgi:hypothetical protein
MLAYSLNHLLLLLSASGDKLKIIGRGNFLIRLDDTKDMVVQALIAQIIVLSLRS